MLPLSLLSWPVWSVTLNIFSLKLPSMHQSPWYYPQGSSLREEAFFLQLLEVLQDKKKKEKRKRQVQDDLFPQIHAICPPRPPSCSPWCTVTERKEPWLERLMGNPQRKLNNTLNGQTTHSCLLLAPWKMPLKAEMRKHFAESKGIDSPATFSHSFL